MKYLIAYLIEGDAKDWHDSLAREISEKFGTWKIHERIVPHVTLYRPFISDDIKPVEELLMNYVENAKSPGNFSMNSFDRFGDRVVFAKIDPDPIVHASVTDLREKIQLLPGRPPQDFPDWNPHATLAESVTPEEIAGIWQYVSAKPAPEFRFPFDTITILAFEGSKWNIVKTFSFSKN